MRTLLPAFITSSGRLPDNNLKLTTSLSKLNFIYFLARTEGINGNSYVFLSKNKQQEWMEHWSTDFWKSETSRNNQKIISTSYEHLKTVS